MAASAPASLLAEPIMACASTDDRRASPTRSNPLCCASGPPQRLQLQLYSPSRAQTGAFSATGPPAKLPLDSMDLTLGVIARATRAADNPHRCAAIIMRRRLVETAGCAAPVRKSLSCDLGPSHDGTCSQTAFPSPEPLWHAPVTAAVASAPAKASDGSAKAGGFRVSPRLCPGTKLILPPNRARPIVRRCHTAWWVHLAPNWGSSNPTPPPAGPGSFAREDGSGARPPAQSCPPSTRGR